MFNKASTRRAFEDVVEQIREAIVAGRLMPGDRLPPQREMKEMFQVSRATIMEALRVLEKADLITIRPGTTGGAFVSHATTDTVAESILLLLSLEGVSIEELGEFRERVESGTAYWAAQRADATEMDDLRSRVARLRKMASVSTPWATFLAEDFALHHAIAEYSRNRPSVATMKAITSAMQHAYSYISNGLYDKVLSDTGGIVDAICNREAELAEERMKAHIRFFYEDMMANWKSETDSGRLDDNPDTVVYYPHFPRQKIGASRGGMDG